MSIREFSRAEIADLRAEIDLMSNWMLAQKFHSLIDDASGISGEAKEEIDRLKEEVAGVEEDNRCLEKELRASQSRCDSLELKLSQAQAKRG